MGQVTNERRRVAATLAPKGINYAPTQTNFVFYDTGASAKKL